MVRNKCALVGVIQRRRLGIFFPAKVVSGLIDGSKPRGRLDCERIGSTQ